MCEDSSKSTCFQALVIIPLEDEGKQLLAIVTQLIAKLVIVPILKHLNKRETDKAFK